MKVIETGIGYSILKVTNKTKPVKKVRIAVLQRLIEPSNQTYQDIYLQASAFSGQNKTPEAFEKVVKEKGLAKRNAPNIKAMDNSIMGLPSAREVIRWSFSENVKIGEVSPVFDLSGKYAVAILKNTSEKGVPTLEKIKDRIEPSVRNVKKIEMLAEKMKKALQTSKDIYLLAQNLNSKVDTVGVSFAGFGGSAIGREVEIIGEIFSGTMKKGELYGPLTGNFGAYFVIIDNIPDVPKKDDFTYERTQMQGMFESRVNGKFYQIMQNAAKIEDNRPMFY
jgi:hypothetical protein